MFSPNPSPSSCWRLIPPIAADGLTQMAIDDWMLDRVRQGHPPILRFYTWSKPTLSLGFHQKQRPTVPDSIPLVRRPTGGRAVLHGSLSDLTYAIAIGTAKTASTKTSSTGQTHTPNECPHPPAPSPKMGEGEQDFEIKVPLPPWERDLGRGVTEYAFALTSSTISKRTRRADVYCNICRFLIRGWSQLGVTLHFGNDRDYANRTSCFGTATAADLVTDDGAKLIGSAQLYRGDTVLQHGSMQLAPDRELFAQIFGEPCRAAVLPELTAEEIIATLTEAARSSFGETFETRELDAAEWQDIEARRDRFRATTLRTVTLG